MIATQNSYLSNFGADTANKYKSYDLVFGHEFLPKYPAPFLELSVWSFDNYWWPQILQLV